MQGPILRALIIFGVLYFAYGAIFLAQLGPDAGDLAGYKVAVTAAVWALKAVAYTLAGRGALGLFFSFDRPIAFFAVFRGVTDPFLALMAPVTPGFLIEKMVPFYSAFLFFALAYVIPSVAIFLLLALR